MRGAHASLAFLSVVVLLGLAGCVTSDTADPVVSCGDGTSAPSGTLHGMEAWGHDHACTEPFDLLYLASASFEPNVTVRVTDGSGPQWGDGNDLPFERIDLGRSNSTAFGAIRIPPTSPEGYDVVLRVLDADGCAPAGLTTNYFAQVRNGPAAAPGQGVHVLYAGFWENGTLFDTNLKGVDLSDWPRASWYEGGHWDALPVYVYDQDASETPAYWRDPFGQVPAPVAGPASPVLAPADAAVGAGYYPTIKGFNEAVKGLPAGTRQVFHIAPEDAYTREGREDHPLYGDALVFLVEVVDVVAAPCPSPPMAGSLACAVTAQ